MAVRPAPRKRKKGLWERIPVLGELITELPWREFKAAVNRFVVQSRPFTASLCLHLAVLLGMALWFVRAQPQRRPVLSLAFASPLEASPGVVAVAIPVSPTPEPEPVPMPVAKPVVPEPEAAVPAPPVAEEAAAVSAADARPPVVGGLLDGREEGRREALVAEFGGSGATEAAVARALDWLVKQQRTDGLWNLKGPYPDGGSQENRLAATAMALLALQGAGNTPAEGRHKAAVERGWRGLLQRQLADGSFDIPPLPSQHGLYSHAQATIALCELFGMTRDERFEKPARQAVAYALAAQGPNGGWRYEPGKPGDMSVTGWYVMALKSAEMAGIELPAETWVRVGEFVDSVALDEGSRYGYRLETPLKPPGPATAAVSAEGLLCRQYLGWPPTDRRLRAGIDALVAANPVTWPARKQKLGPGADAKPKVLVEKDVYAWYYITQIAHHHGGDPWERWNARLRQELPGGQVAEGAQAGSWDPSMDKWGHVGGRLFTTCFCTWMLEVYYRHLPLYRTASPQQR